MTAMTATITTSISAGNCRHMGCTHHSNSHASIGTASIGSSIMAANIITGSRRSVSSAFAAFPRFVMGGFLPGGTIWVSLYAFFVPAAWDAEAYGFALHDWNIVSKNSMQYLFLMSLVYITSTLKGSKTLIISMIAWLISVVGINQGIC